MTKLQLLHRAVNERLQAAVEQIMEMVGGTVLEYEEETVRVRTENEILRRRLRWMEGENPTDWPDPTERTVLSVLGHNDFSQTEKQDDPKNSQNLHALIIKTESIDASDFEAFGRNTSLTTSMSNDLESITPSTSTPADTGLRDGIVWDSVHNYMAPIDFDPTLPIGRSRNQRKSFACPDCGKVFGREQTLIFHMRVHSTERPYAYRRRKTCFYGDKKQKKKIRGLSKLSKEFVEDLSDASEQTERSTGSANISVPITAEPGAPEAETGEPADEGSEHNGSSKCSEESAAKPVALKTKQRPEKAKIHHCQQCNRAYTHLSRLVLHMKTHDPPFSNQELKEEKETEKPDKSTQQPDKQLKDQDAQCSKVDMLKKVYSCPHCDKVFTRGGWLAPHIRSHALQRARRSDILPEFILPDFVHRRSRRVITQLKYGSDDQDTKEPNTETETFEIPSIQLQAETPESEQSVTVELEPSSESQRIKSDEPESTNNDSKTDNEIENMITEESGNPHGVLKESLAETGDAKKAKKRFPCQECGKVYLLAGCLKTHKKMHQKERLQEEKKIPITLLKGFGQSESKSVRLSLVEKKKKKKKMNSYKINQIKQDKINVPPNLHDKKKKKKSSNNGLTSKEGLSSEESTVQKEKHGSKASFPCPICDKVFPRAMRMMVHMQIHSGERPYPYRQRKEQFYSDLTRPRVPDTEKQEPAMKSSDERENPDGKDVNMNQTSAVSQDFTSTSEPMDTVQPQFGRKFSLLPLPSASPTNIQSTNHLRTDSNVDGLFSLQPRIFIDETTAQSKCAASSSGEDFSSAEHGGIKQHHITDSRRVYPAADPQVKCVQEQPLMKNVDTCEGQSILSGFPDSTETEAPVVHIQFESIEMSCSARTNVEDQFNSESSAAKMSEVWRESGLMECNNCSLSDDDQTLGKSDQNEINTNVKSAHSESVMMTHADISGDESNVDRTLAENKTPIPLTKGLLDEGLFDSCPIMEKSDCLSISFQEANDSNLDLGCKLIETPKQSFHECPHSNKDRTVAISEHNTGDPYATEQKSWFTCGTCSLMFAREAFLIQHMKVHSVTEDSARL